MYNANQQNPYAGYAGYNGYGAQTGGYGGYGGYGGAPAPGYGGYGNMGMPAGMPGGPGDSGPSKMVIIMPPGNSDNDNNKKKKGGWGCLFWLAMMIFIACLCALGVIVYTYMAQSNMYEDIAKDYAEIVEADPNDPDSEPIFNIDWDALRAINPEVIAWLYVPDTPINYPVLHKPGDSEYYLHYNFRNETYSVGAEYGAIFLAGENRPNLEDDVNVFYGHNMRNGTMFAILNQFQNDDVFNEHRTIYLIYPDGVHKLRTFAVDHVPDTDTSVVVPHPPNLEEYVENKIEESIVHPDGEIPAAKDITKVFVFSTCDGADNRNRYVTFAYQEQFFPNSQNYVGQEGNSAGISQDVLDAVEGSGQGRLDNEGYAPSEE